MTTLARHAAVLVLTLACLAPARALERIARAPYVGAIVTDADSGAILFADRADAPAYPASVTKLMTFAVVMDRVVAGQLALDAPVTVAAEAARTGGSQVYLKQGEVFTVEDLFYALMISSANDAAVALALHVGGSREGFVALMNEKARALGMTGTVFHSPHGLPPSAGQPPDVATARDVAMLARELIRREHVLTYSAVKVRMLRERSAQPFEMRNHNHLLGKLAGCDGLKTGYYTAAGFSLAATAERQGRRVIAVVLGSDASKTRDFKTMELVEFGFAHLPPAGGAPADAAPSAGAPPAPVAQTPAAAVPRPPEKPAAHGTAASTAPEPAVIFRVIPPAKKP